MGDDIFPGFWLLASGFWLHYYNYSYNYYCFKVLVGGLYNVDLFLLLH